MKIKYWKEISEANREKFEGIHSKPEKLWELINEKLQSLAFPMFITFDNFKYQVKVIAQVEDSIYRDRPLLKDLMAINEIFIEDILIKQVKI